MFCRTLALALLSALTLSSAALAQALGEGSTVFTTEAVDLLRFPDAALTLTTLEILLVDGALVRVRKGVDIGWLPVAKVSATPPAPALALPEAPAAPTLPATPTPTAP
jgi:hypothetical protein